METISLYDLCHEISDVLATGLPGSCWVRAEIASLTLRNGHAYFELVEKAESGVLAAKARATCWASTYKILSAFFAEETGEALRTGMQILVEAEVSFHAVYGLSLNIINIDPSYTIGDMARKRLETIRRLQADGVWDLQRAFCLPTLIRRIAVISSKEAAGYEDFIHQLAETHYDIHAELFPAIVQGDQAERSIITALLQISNEADRFDAVVIIRGGGATTDLGCFDSYELANHCAQFPLPVLTGIGHTRDISIVDMIAHLPLKTPTAVAAFLIGRFRDEEERIHDLRQRLARTRERQILIRQHRIDMLRMRLETCNPERIYRRGYSLLTDPDGHIIRSVEAVRPGQRLLTHLSDGQIISRAE
jgi:exodeoxyribonuclease VII large subunit